MLPRVDAAVVHFPVQDSLGQAVLGSAERSGDGQLSAAAGEEAGKREEAKARTRSSAGTARQREEGQEHSIAGTAKPAKTANSQETASSLTDIRLRSSRCQARQAGARRCDCPAESALPAQRERGRAALRLPAHVRQRAPCRCSSEREGGRV